MLKVISKKTGKFFPKSMISTVLRYTRVDATSDMQFASSWSDYSGNGTVDGMLCTRLNGE